MYSSFELSSIFLRIAVDYIRPTLCLQERQNLPKVKGEKKHKERAKINHKINELLSIKAIFRDARQCPSCKMAISRTEGCNMMVCRNCCCSFCYRCNKAIDSDEHFRSSFFSIFRIHLSFVFISA